MGGIESKIQCVKMSLVTRFRAVVNAAHIFASPSKKNNRLHRASQEV